MDARDTAELLVSCKFYKTDPNDHIKQEICKLAKAYLDLVNAEPVAWLIVHIMADQTIEKEVVLSPLTDDTYMGEGDEAFPLYLRKE